MGCGCRGKRGIGRNPIVSPRNNRAITSTGRPIQQNQIQSLSIQSNEDVDAATQGMSKERRELERKRRAQIALRRRTGSYRS